MRPITRIRLVLPSLGGQRASATVEALAARIADAFAVHGVQVRQQIQGAALDGAPRADVALWLPQADGATATPDVRWAPARVQVGLVVEPGSSPRSLGRFDALLVPHEGLRDPLRAALKRASARDVPVVTARLCGTPLMAREAEKALRGVAGRPVVLLDVREERSGEADGALDGDIERLVVQLALMGHGAAVVLLAPHEERARARVRTLCELHGVDAWLASGADGLVQSLAAADLFLGRPSWDELLLAALHRVAVARLPMSGPRALLDALQDHKPGGRHVDDVTGTLQLAAALDRRLADPGALEARGIALREALFGGERELLEAIAALEPMPQGALAQAAWEPVGPHAAHKAAAPAGVVEARDANAPPEPTRAQKIEDALEALKAKIATGGAG
jgi:hypothetical protein